MVRKFELLLVGAFDKQCTTVTVASFFRQTPELILYEALFGVDLNRFCGNPVVAGWRPCFGQIFFRASKATTRPRVPL